MLALLAPGQGSQKPGFLTPWLDLPGADARLRWQSALAGVDLVRLGVHADADELRDTAKTQPLLVAAGLLAASQLPLYDVAVVAGHSVGELTAAALAGALTPESAVTLAAVRGREMAAACAVEPTGMSAVLGGDPDEVLARIDACGLHPANRNGAGQVVAAGPLTGLEELAAKPPAKARVIPLQVAGAFHTPHMKPAEVALEAIAAGITASDPQRIMLSNADGAAAGNGADLLVRLVRQVTSPVRWDLCMASLLDLGVTAVIELPPAGALAGLAKRDLKGVEIVKVNTPDDLDAARDLIARHGAPAHIVPEPTVHFRVAVSPTSGHFQPAELAEGATVTAGQQIGQVVTRRGAEEITATHDGVLVEWLADPEDPVASGAPLARFSHPDATGADG
ncbi:MAG: acyltransferase domain-containing protein [Micromonosporaceae bacterium]|nr:acyltransferase domain-containing protein [Micromonosporaceae bacterium]